MTLPTDLPATPLAIELTVRHSRPWWQVADRDIRLQRWEVSADVSQLIPCGEVFRHVADLTIDLLDLRCAESAPEHIGDDWMKRFVADSVLEDGTGRLCAELEERTTAGVPRAVFLRSVRVMNSWRGQGLGGVLIASTLRTWAHSARIGVCRISPDDFAHGCPDAMAAEFAVIRMVALLERLGFVPWRDVHVVDLKHPALRDVRIDVIRRWWPDPDDSHG